MGLLRIVKIVPWRILLGGDRAGLIRSRELVCGLTRQRRVAGSPRATGDAHDWRPFVRYTLQCEGVASPTERQIREREEITRSRITKLLQVDARHADPLGERNGSRYGTVISAYCADSATGDRATWETFMQHIAGLVRPGGMFITAALRRCRRYLVGGKAFPSADVDENDLRAVLEPQFVCEGGSIEAWDLAEHESQGYTGIVLGWAWRSVQVAVGG
jgi:hypothetical protein